MLSNAILYTREIKFQDLATLHLVWSAPNDSISFRPNHKAPVIITSNESLQSKISKSHQAKIAFQRLNTKHSFPVSSMCKTASDCNGEEKSTP